MKKEIKISALLLLLVGLFFSHPTFGQTTEDEGIEIEVKTPKDTTKVKISVESTADDKKKKDSDDDDDDDDNDWDEEWEDDDDDDDDDGKIDWDIDWNNKDDNAVKTSNGGTIRFTMLDIGLSGYLFDDGFSLPADLDDYELLYGGSLNINLHLFRHRMPIIKNTAFLEYGLSFSWMQYKFANDFIFLEDKDFVTVEPIDDDLRKNKLKTTFIEVPLMLTITPGKDDSYFISGGMYAGVLVGSKQKIKSSDGDVTKIRDDFNLNKIRYGIEGRLGLGPVSFFAQYSLVDLFEDNQGPELTPINFGITVLGF